VNFADLGAIKHIIQNCRARDRAEIEALYGLEATLDSAPAWAAQACLLQIFDWRTKPVAFVAVHALTHTVCLLSMIATEDWPRVAPSVIRWAKREAMPKLTAMHFKRAECRSIEGHPEAIRFLQHLGFEVEAYVKRYGRAGEDFIQFAYTRPRAIQRNYDDVFFCPKTPDATETAHA
jgi:hypothetical protein